MRESISPEQLNALNRLRQIRTQFALGLCWTGVFADPEDHIIVVSKSAPHVIVYCSALVEGLLGYSADEVFGTTLDKYLEEHDRSSSIRDTTSSRRTTTAAANRKTTFFGASLVTTELTKFYEQMRLLGRAHTVIAVLDTHEGATTCSINSFLISGTSVEEPVSDKGAADVSAPSVEVESVCFGLLISPLAMTEVSLL